MDTDKRSFTVEQTTVGNKGGRYLSKTPGAAARKACNKLLKGSKCKSVNFTIKETTRGSKEKTFTYTGKIHILPEPIIIDRGGTEYEILTKCTVKKSTRQLKKKSACSKKTTKKPKKKTTAKKPKKKTTRRRRTAST